ncbi:RNA polymerase II transcription factor B subunit 1 [Blastocladiella emersonii ATCC 22665]|nr:RNA polymerase II transcription factor B subunit 1 [Blastocladiella emersonii ATCC 22665]
MSSAILAVPARIKKRDGTLALTADDRLVFEQARDDGAVRRLEVALADVKTQMQSAKGKPVLKLITTAGDDHTFHFTASSPDVAAGHCAAVKDAIVAFMARRLASPAETAPLRAVTSLPLDQELVLRSELLKKHRTLAKLHRDLVKDGKLVSETEFWEARRDLVERAALEASQARGPKSAWLHDVRPKTVENKSVYTLTPQIINAIFTQFPSVAQMYRDTVPDKLSEADFWSQFVRSKFLHKLRPTANAPADAASAAPAAAGKDDDSDDMFDRCLREELNRKGDTGDVRLTLDLAATLNDRLEINGNAPDKMMTFNPLDPEVSLLRNFNRHSAQVLKAVLEHQRTHPITSSDLLAHEVEIDDLSLPARNELIPLRIADRHMFPGSRPAYRFPTPSSTSPTAYADSFTHSKLSLGAAIRADDCAAAAADLASLLRNHATASRSVASLDVLGVPAGPAKELTQLHATATELLRHFWGAARADPDKQKRMRTALERHRDKVVHWAAGHAGVVHVQPVVDAIIGGIARALAAGAGVA